MGCEHTRGHGDYAAESAGATANHRATINSFIDQPDVIKKILQHLGQWAVFEPNQEATWAKVCRLVSDLLLEELRNGAL